MSPLFTEESYIDRDTILDITVNVIPIAILAFFVVYFLAFSPWGYDPEIVVIQHFLTLFPLLMLAILTYVSARIVSRDEEQQELESEERQELESET